MTNAVAESAVKMPVPLLDSVNDRILDFSRLRLPCPEPDGGDLCASV